jgi:hypothetical protein
VTGAKRTTAPKRRRRARVWDAAQGIAWHVHRTERAANDAEGVEGVLNDVKADRDALDAKEENPKGVRSVALPVAILFEWNNPYFANGAPTAGAVIGYYASAETEFRNAIAEGRLTPREDGRFNRKDVQDLWPSNGSGNSEKPFLARALIDEAIDVITREPSRQGVISKLGSKGLTKQQKQSAVFRAAIDKATRDHESAGHRLVTTPSEAKDLLANDPTISERARKGLQQIARMKEPSSEDRKVRIQRIKAFEKRTLRPK